MRHYYCDICEEFESETMEDIVEHIHDVHSVEVNEILSDKAMICDDEQTCLRKDLQ